MAYPGDRPELFPQPSLGDLIGEAREIMAKAKERFKPVATFALFSGGNDSTAMLHLVKDQVDAAVHIVTGIGIPETTEFVRQTCDALGLPLIELRTDPSEYVLIVLGDDGFFGNRHPGLGRGFPGPGSHSICYNRLKERHIGRIQRDRSRPGQVVLLVSGIRHHESERRKINIASRDIQAPDPSSRLNRLGWANPIVAWTKRNLADYREQHGVPQSPVAALIHKSGECLCGAFAKKGELEEIEFWFPETGKYIRSLEREAERAGKPYCRWGWGHDKLVGVPAPGPLCSSCELFKHMGEK